tara:strand:+ start:1026 stop:2807 length:1782 start_codon:yes stop_codon:yes gene_type:complete
MSTSIYRSREIEKVIQSAFKQFDISDPNEMKDISNSIKSQLNSASIVSSFSESLLASSSAYRADVRSALIDIIAQLFNVRDLNGELNQLESQSRWIIESAKAKLMKLEKKLLTAGKFIKESFEEGVDSGLHNNTIVKDGKLRVDKTNAQLKVTKITIETSPATSAINNTFTEVSGDASSLLKTGVGSDLYKVHIVCPSIPRFYYNQKFYEGMKTELFLETEEALVSAVSAKCSNVFRIISIEGYNSASEWDPNVLPWDILGEDETLGQTSFINTSPEKAYSLYKVVLHSPDYESLGSFYKLVTILHNIKLFKKDSTYSIDKGYFISHEYEATNSLFKVVFDASYSGNVSCWIDFLGRPDLDPSLVVPKDEDTVTLTKYFNSDSESGVSLEVLPVQDTITVTSAAGIPLEFGEYNDGILPIISSYDGYLFIFFTIERQPHTTQLLSPAFNEALILEPYSKTELHDNIDGFIFPLQSIPWRPVGLSSFVIKVDNAIIIIEELAIVDGAVVEFDDTKNQFYYYNKALYTNFDLMSLGSVITVDYYMMCDGVKLRIDLSNNDMVDDYKLELVEIQQEVYKAGGTNQIPTAIINDNVN